ncbi:MULTISPECIES: 50S ribosomal protein L11 methyltransferase [Prevotellaceae]|uniref:50S ribosomal protein L11 methyltransferase n=1 Tax=Leyella stercorea TaxID=363265 RepID=UPI001F28BFC1|nr:MULTISPECIES: 50S ribosomal protein L11 methyltransferase [Prevotellaceae]MCF2579652.1 50S ribosomal protein L11 methyltransferase [Leyella stercorea]MCI7183490.1 50S ribosomal protein L11 methyltransferase [Prevotella sp.]
MKYFVANFKIECEPELMQPARELLSAAACEAGFEAFEDTEDGLQGYVQRPLYNKEALDEAIADYMPEGATVTYDVEEVPDQDWNQGWEEEGFEPIGVSENLIIYDAKHTDMNMFAGNDGVMRIFIEARNAFGTGTHQTTRMILRRLLGMNLNGKKVLDCGCGTGILGIVASRLGADRVLGYDIDEWSSENAKHNASINGVGNLDVMLGDASVLDVVDEEFDVVIANINRNILINDMSAFKRHMKNDGCLILSGFYESDVPMLEKAAMDNAMSLKDVVTDEEWACALFEAN